ncbi:MAG: S41 family peptidase [Pseudomonadota bacterium]
MRSWIIGPAIGAVLGASAFVWTANGDAGDRQAETYRQLELFAEILARVQADYVEDVNEADVIEASIDGMLASLDPHSSYLNPDEFRDMQVQTSGEYGGLGIEVTSEDGFVKVVAPMDDTPASRAGLISGDYLSAINGDPIVGLPLNDAVKQMRGPIGSDITITVLREGEEPFDVTLTREVIRPGSVNHRMEANIGYVRVSTFNDRTSDSLKEALDELKKDSRNTMDGLVLDLRNNPGGLLDQAVEVSSMFLDGGEVVSTRGRRSGDVQRYNARRGQRFDETPIVVIINGGSASAAEIVAGALQDRGRATVLGLASFGKGSVQTVIPLGPQRGAMRLTTSRYYTPSGKSIQGAGIEPDVEVAQVRLTEEELKEIATRAERYSEAALPNALENDQGLERRAPHIPDDQPPEDYEGDDYQLDRAFELLRTKSVALDSRAG